MSFGHVQGNTQLTDSEAEQKKKQELEQLGESIAQAQTIQDSLTATEQQVLDAKDSLIVVQNELDQKNSELSVLQGSILEAQSTLESLHNQASEFSDIQEKVDSLNQAQTDLLAKIDELSKIKLQLENDISALQLELEGITEKYNTTVEQYDTNLASLSQNEAILTSQIDELNTKISDLQKQSSSLDADILEKTSKISELEEAQKSHQSEIESLIIDYGNKQKELADSLSAMSATKQEEWDKQDGDISKRWEILNTKTEQLKQAKADLESFFNKTINLII